MRPRLAPAVLGSTLCAFVSFAAVCHAETRLKFILIFLADGGGLTQLETARAYNRVVFRAGTVITDKVMSEGSFGMLTTHSAERLVTDSAAAATAMAAGCKAKIGAVGICHNGRVPDAVMEVARASGKRVGVVTNSYVYDATPAAFLAHVPSRRDYAAIIEQYRRFKPDVLLGGGSDFFLPRSRKGSRRKDDADLIAGFKRAGYAFVSERAQLKDPQGGKVLGLFSPGEMRFEIDRDGDVEPSLDEMTEAALRTLETGRGDGFVLLVESEHIDSAAHLNDPAALLRAWREFDRAVAAGYRFFRRRPQQTLLLVTSDHDTGGFGLTGDASVRELKKLRSIGISFRKATDLLGDRPSAQSVDRLIAEHFKGFVLPAELREAIVERRHQLRPFTRNPTAAALGVMVATQIQASWVSPGPTNQPVFVAAIGVGAARFRGYQDNTDFGRHLLDLVRKPVKD